MGGLPDPDWYFEHVLIDAEPGGPRRLETGPAALWQRWWRQQALGPEPITTASTQGFVLRPGELTTLGISRSSARTEVRNGRWLVPSHGAVAPLRIDGAQADGTPANRYVIAHRQHALVAAAVALNCPSCVVSAGSAAILRGLPTMAVPRRPELTAAGDLSLGRRSRSHVFGAGLPVDVIERWFGVAVTSVARVLVDQARHDRRNGLMAADAALRERLVTVAGIEHELQRAAGWPGVVQARALLALADPKAESPLESITRLALHDSGFPAPELQFEIGGYAVDLCWPDRRLVIEADGRGKYSDDALWREKSREKIVRECGYRVERVIWSDVVRDWPSTYNRIRAAW